VSEPDLWSRKESTSVGARQVDALDLVGRFLHSCVHASTSPTPRLWVLRDVAQLHERAAQEVGTVHARASRNGLEPAVAHAVLLVQHHLDHVGPLTDWATSRRVTRRDTVRLKAYGKGRGEAARALATLVTARGLRYRASLARDLLLPTRTYLARQGTTRSQRLRRGASKVARRGR
jgi:hypothetical protein